MTQFAADSPLLEARLISKEYFIRISAAIQIHISSRTYARLQSRQSILRNIANVNDAVQIGEPQREEKPRITCNHNLTCPLQVLESQWLLQKVISLLENVQDLVNCTAVNRSWKLATKSAQLYLMSEKKATDCMQWLQTQFKQGMFGELAVLYVGTDYAEANRHYDGAISTTPTLLWLFWQPLLMLSGLWCLHTCKLEGAIEIKQAAALLPPCIEDLELCSTQSRLNGQMNICLSMFARFSGLHTLGIMLAEANTALQHTTMTLAL